MHPLCLKIIDTPEFQRLRNLKQCGICHFVYPSAVHTRFEHSIGVYHLAGEFLNKLKKSVEITKEEELCVKTAALLHDIGHGPFSHLWETFVNGRNEEKWKHEDMSLKIFDHLIKTDSISSEFNKYNLDVDHKNLIRNIISGDPSSIPGDKLFLLEIVANKKTNIDVDRWDYMMRDAYFFGVICTVRIDRIISDAIVKKMDNNQHRIAFRDKLCDNILEMFQCRMKLHKICYQHRVCKNLELMLVDALNAADDKFFKNGVNLSKCHKDIESFIQLNDGLFENILYSIDDKLDKARKILRRILCRDLYVHITTLQLKETIPYKKLLEFESKMNSKYKTCVRLGLININMGVEDESPLKPVLFFSKTGDLLVEPEFVSDNINLREIKLLVFSVEEIEDKNLMKRVVNELKTLVPLKH